MKKIESLFTGIFLIAIIIVTGLLIWNNIPTQKTQNNFVYETNKYGAFLAAQHAIYVNDFEKAGEFSEKLEDKDIDVIKNTILLSDFLNGKIPDSADILKDETGPASRMIYDAYLIKNNKWADVYKLHKKDGSALTSPIRIWSGVATGKSDEVFKFIDKLNTSSSWKSFVRGQIYAETDKIKKAAAEFEKVPVEFMNINDYLYIMAFYNHNNMNNAAEILHQNFTERPAGMYILNADISADWSNYTGFNNALAFNLIQNVSHTQFMIYSDLSLLLLRMAEVVKEDKTSEKDAINYYLGYYFINNSGDAYKYFKNIDSKSPFYLFGILQYAEKTGKTIELEKAIDANPLFVPAILKLVSKNVQQGNKRSALRIINTALKNKNLSKTGRAFFLKSRANVYLVFGDLKSAQSDIRDAADILPMDAGILAIQAKIWAIQSRELDTAYEYAIALVRKNPTEIETWDVLGRVVNAKEGKYAALEVIEKVAQVSETCSSLFEQLGDLYKETGKDNLAKDAYLRAIDLSDDGLVVIQNIKRKLRNLK